MSLRAISNGDEGRTADQNMMGRVERRGLGVALLYGAGLVQLVVIGTTAYRLLTERHDLVVVLFAVGMMVLAAMGVAVVVMVLLGTGTTTTPGDAVDDQ
jgi:hypothetical protein